jgi:hypothetical protein
VHCSQTGHCCSASPLVTFRGTPPDCAALRCAVLCCRDRRHPGQRPAGAHRPQGEPQGQGGEGVHQRGKAPRPTYSTPCSPTLLGSTRSSPKPVSHSSWPHPAPSHAPRSMLCQKLKVVALPHARPKCVRALRAASYHPHLCFQPLC